jgi:hypothetical protein
MNLALMQPAGFKVRLAKKRKRARTVCGQSTPNLRGRMSIFGQVLSNSRILKIESKKKRCFFAERLTTELFFSLLSALPAHGK